MWIPCLDSNVLLCFSICLETGLEKASIRKYAHKIDHEGEDIKYEADFVVPPDFGEIGAIFVENEHHKEMYLHDVVLDGFPTGPVHVTCDSWIHSKFDNKKKRLFFTNKVSYFLLIRFVINIYVVMVVGSSY